ncbi:asparagine synthase-related protein [Rhizobium leguminosarum]|uniref:asparagine synthase-related protein n=1 Tax=Rhizobium leguminosarum TaxID=384 RepID=UPI0004099BDC|nr:asparagine synthase-related protein [Rhizobium leguminosarum]
MTAFRGILGSNVTDDALCLFDGGAAPKAFSICGGVFGLGTAEKATLITRHDYIVAICGCPSFDVEGLAQPLSADQVAPSILRGGADLVSRLSGCFSLAHWSMRDACLTLYRDPSGTYPLSYQQRDGRLIFASDNGGAAADWLPVPPGEVLVFDKCAALLSREQTDKCKPTNISVVGGRTAQLIQSMRLGEWSAVVLDDRKLSKDLAFRLRCFATDVPLHSFSAGLGRDDPSVLVARDAASRVGTVHHEIIVHPSALKELLPAVVKILGKPAGNIRTCLHYALWREAAEYVQKLFVAHTARTLCNGAVVASGDQTDEPTTQKMLAKTLGLELHFLSIGREMLPPTIGGPNSPQVGDRNISARSVVETSTGKNGLRQYRKTLADALSELADTYLAGPTLLRTAIDKHVIDDLKRSDGEPYDEKRFRNLWEAVTAEVWARQCAAVRSRGRPAGTLQ